VNYRNFDFFKDIGMEKALQIFLMFLSLPVNCVAAVTSRLKITKGSVDVVVVEVCSSRSKVCNYII
jgi:hypothetical protein